MTETIHHIKVRLPGKRWSSRDTDEGFAGKMMGDGAGVTPTDGRNRGAEDGVVAFVFETKHALGFQTDSGLEMLLHIGIDTVALNGHGI